MATLPQLDSQIWKAGVYDQNGTVVFDMSGGPMSKITEQGNSSIEVVRLDDVITGPVTFIKMDIEGGEAAALRGAARLLKEYKPKLAICVYHKPDDFRCLPLLIKSLNPDYKEFYLRHQKPHGFGESVLFVR